MTHSAEVDGVAVLAESVVPPPTAIPKLNQNVCAAHKGGSNNSLTKTATNNRKFIAFESAHLGRTIAAAGAIEHRSERIRRRVACDRGQPVILLERMEHIDRDFLRARPALQAFLASVLASLPAITVTGSLSRIDISADGYFVGIDAAGDEEFHYAVRSELELKSWRQLVAACFECLKGYMDIHSSSDEAWLTIPGLTDVSEPIPIASVIIVRPVSGVRGQVLVPRIGYALRDWIEINPTSSARFRTVLPNCVGNTAPQAVIRISLLSPDWLRRVYEQPVVRSAAKSPAKSSTS